MKIRNKGTSTSDKVELQMTPMIDVVFQLLTFFIMSFKIVSEEGDFNVKMPLSSTAEGNPEENTAVPVKLRMRADANGNLASMSVVEQNFGQSFQELTRFIKRTYGTESGPGTQLEGAEVELDCDYNLKYNYVIAAITAVSGERNGDQIVRLVEKIKFSPPRKPNESG